MADRRNEPALQRRRLRSELRKAREHAQLTQRDVAKDMDWSLSKLIRIETGSVGITTNDLRALLALYGIADLKRVEALVEMARKARERSWWSSYREYASPELIAMLGYESSASIIRNFEPLLVPGLLQTEEYAQELFRHLRGSKDYRRVDSLVNLRMERQELLTQKDAPRLHFVLDEAVLRRHVGGPALMRRQLERLLQLMQEPHITLRVVPFSQGWYRSLRVPYMLFEFADPADDTILYLEYPNQELVLVEEDTTTTEDDIDKTSPAVYLEIFWELEQQAPKETSRLLIEDAIAKLPSPSAAGDKGETQRQAG